MNYANGHWRELIDRYETMVLWNDIAYPANTDLNVLFADYYNRLPEGVVNNRFTQRFQMLLPITRGIPLPLSCVPPGHLFTSRVVYTPNGNRFG